MCEEVARTVHIARQLGEPLPIAQSDIDSLYARYQNVYGQTEEQMIMTTIPHRAGSSPEARASTVPRRSPRSSSSRAPIVEQLNDAGTLPVPVEWKPVLTDSGAIHRIIMAANADPDCIGLIAWMHTFSPAKMWITGLDALRTPFLHLHTQANVSLPWAEIDMDFMNLNQAAHGDREFGYIQTRLGVPRTTVAGHVSDPTTQARIAGWQRAARGVAAIRSLKLARFGDNMRNVAVTEGDKVEAELRFGVSVNTYGVNDLVERVDAVTDAEVDDLLEQYADAYEIAPELPGRRRSARVAALRRQDRRRSALVPHRGRVRRVHHQLRGPRRAAPAAGSGRAAADGRGLRVRRRGRLEDLGHAAHDQGDRRRRTRRHVVHGGLHLPPRVRARRRSSARTCSRSARPSPPTEPRIEIHPLGIGNREDPVRLVFDAAPGPATILGICDLGDRFRLVLNEVDVVPPDEPLPKLPVARAVWEPKPDLATSAESWITAGGPHHTVLSTAVDTDAAGRLRQPARRRAVDHRRLDQPARLRRPDPLEPGVLPPGPGVLRRMASATCVHARSSRGPHRPRDRAGLDPDQGGADRPGPRTARGRQPRLGEPVRRPAVDLLPGRGLGRAAAVLRRPGRRRAAALRRRADHGRRARRLGDDARLPRLRRRRRAADARSAPGATPTPAPPPSD